MPLLIEEPVSGDTRSRNGDFLELSAITSSRGVSSEASLVSILRITEDPAADAENGSDPETGEILDGAILEQPREYLTVTAFEELMHRQSCLRDCYPFVVDAARGTLTYQGPDCVTHPGRLVYLFCLMATAIRERRLLPSAAFKYLEQTIGNCFQICACIAAGEFVAGAADSSMTGHVSSFGFPRATGTAFLPALREAYERFGVGRVRQSGEIPEGLPQELKDGGIDVIAWRTLPDQLPGRMYMLGQCASGKNWRNKSVVEYVEQLHGGWFTNIPAKYSMPAMFIPFPFHHELSEQKEIPFLESVRQRSWYEEMRFGIIFDRLRIPSLAGACMVRPEVVRANVDGTTRLSEVQQWVVDAVQAANS
jgi:hypothetical protein